MFPSGTHVVPFHWATSEPSVFEKEFLLAAYNSPAAPTTMMLKTVFVVCVHVFKSPDQVPESGLDPLIQTRPSGVVATDWMSAAGELTTVQPASL